MGLSYTPVAAAHNAKKGVEHALKACGIAGWGIFSYVDTPAAAYAEADEFASAIDFQWFTLSLLGTDQAERREAEARLG